LHGDLSPNNFIIHEGIGYFIDFDHAGFIEEGKACTTTADTTPQLQPIDHYAHDDLESMFYIF
ncbi:hypothetical protein P692DRAFT_20646940, partial [Suillus brevipes Sb2]